MSLLSDRLGQLSNNIFGANVFDVRKSAIELKDSSPTSRLAGDPFKTTKCAPAPNLSPDISFVLLLFGDCADFLEGRRGDFSCPLLSPAPAPELAEVDVLERCDEEQRSRRFDVRTVLATSEASRWSIHSASSLRSSRPSYFAPRIAHSHLARIGVVGVVTTTGGR